MSSVGTDHLNSGIIQKRKRPASVGNYFSLGLTSEVWIRPSSLSPEREREREPRVRECTELEPYNSVAAY